MRSDSGVVLFMFRKFLGVLGGPVSLLDSSVKKGSKTQKIQAAIRGGCHKRIECFIWLTLGVFCS